MVIYRGVSDFGGYLEMTTFNRQKDIQRGREGGGRDTVYDPGAQMYQTLSTPDPGASRS